MVDNPSGKYEEYFTVLRKYRTKATVQSHKFAIHSVDSFCQHDSDRSAEITISDVVEYILSNPSDYTDTTLNGIAQSISNYIAYTHGGNPRLIKHRINVAIQTREDGSGSRTGPSPMESDGKQNNPTNALSQTKREAVDYLYTYARQCKYGSRTHAMLEVLLTSNCHVGALREIDLSDLDLQQDTVSIQTSKKNAIPPQKYIASLSESCTGAIRTYIEHERIEPDGDDDAALFTTPFGRVSTATIRRSVTQACKEALEYHSIKSDDACSDELREQVASLSPHNLRVYALNHLHE